MKAWKILVITLFVLSLFVLSTISSVSALGINRNGHSLNGPQTDSNNHDKDKQGKDTNTNDQTCGNEGFDCECQNYYKDDAYYTIAKWSYGEGNCKGKAGYKVDETNALYKYFNIDVKGDSKSATWTSSPGVSSVIVKAGNKRVDSDGGLSGSVESEKDISHITFCGRKTSGGGGTGGGDNGVPEFPAFTVIVAVLVATVGLVFLRKD